MTRKGGSETKGGFYWKKGEWEIVTVDGKSGVLPGPETAEYIRVPGILLLPVAVFMSILYVIFLPFVGFAMLLGLIATKTGRGLRALAGAAAGRLAVHAPVEKGR
jgi:hypothetical protein